MQVEMFNVLIFHAEVCAKVFGNILQWLPKAKNLTALTMDNYRQGHINNYLKSLSRNNTNIRKLVLNLSSEDLQISDLSSITCLTNLETVTISMDALDKFIDEILQLMSLCCKNLKELSLIGKIHVFLTTGYDRIFFTYMYELMPRLSFLWRNTKFSSQLSGTYSPEFEKLSDVFARGP